MLGSHLATVHNLYFYQQLMTGLRQAIKNGVLYEYERKFMALYDSGID
jgi:queuine tRNA-ribosyltransferase